MPSPTELVAGDAADVVVAGGVAALVAVAGEAPVASAAVFPSE